MYKQQREPLKERYLQITNKLSNIDFKTGDCKAHRIDKINNRSIAFQEKLQNLMLNYNKSVLNFKLEVQQLNDVFQKEQATFQMDIQKLDFDLEEMMKRVQQKLVNEINERQQISSQIQNYSKEKFTYIQADFGNEKSLREEMIDDIHQKLEQLLPKTQQILETAIEDRQVFDDGIIRKANQELSLLLKHVEDNSEKRNDTETQFITMLQDLVHRAKGDLDELKESRIEKYEEIIDLIEKTCDRMVEVSRI